MFADVYAEGGVSVAPFSGKFAVDVDFGHGEDSVEVEVVAVFSCIGGYVEAFAVPADADPREFAGFVFKFGAEGAFDGPVVREVEGAPFCVVEVGSERYFVGIEFFAGGFDFLSGGIGGLDFPDAGPVAASSSVDGEL